MYVNIFTNTCRLTTPAKQRGGFRVSVLDNHTQVDAYNRYWSVLCYPDRLQEVVMHLRLLTPTAR